MNMKLKFLSVVALLFCLCCASTASLAQCKEGFPTDPAFNKAKADEAIAVYGDAIRAGKYREATSGWQWLLTNAPKWNTKLYIDGADIYDKLAEKESDPAKKKVLVDSLMMVYDLRIKNCGDEINVLNRKVYAAYKYAKNKEKVQEVLTMYDQLFEKAGNNVSIGNLTVYMRAVENFQKLHKSLTDDQILQRYDKIMATIEAKLRLAEQQSKKDDIENLKKSKDAVDGILLNLVKVNCDFVKKNLAPKFKKDPSDMNTAKKIYNFMVQDKCTDDPLFLETLEAIDKHNPEKDFGLKKTIAIKYITSGAAEKGEAKLKEAESLAKTPAEKADIYTLFGGIEYKKGNSPGARNYYLKAAEADPSDKGSLDKIGDLYMNSFNDCAKKANLAEDRLVYLAAYEMYQKAGNAAGMAKAKAQFPSKEEIFLLNWQAGSTQKVGCWINESVVLKTRD
jgi:hypothetical protein